MLPFPSKADHDGDGVGDACIGDTDGDSVVDYQVLLLLLFGSNSTSLKRQYNW